MQPFDGTFEMIDPKKIVVDHRYQRPEKEGLIATISRDFAWSSFGALTCYWRGSIPYAVDGQQRLNAALLLDKPPRAVPCVVFSEATIEREAQSFLDIQINRKSVNPFEKHRAQILAKDPVALALERAVATVGFVIGQSSEYGQVKAVRTLHGIYKDLAEEGVVQVMTQVRDAWPKDIGGPSEHLLRGVADVIMDMGGVGDESKYNRAKLTTALRRSTPGDILSKAKLIHYETTASKRKCVRIAMKQLCKV